MNVLTQVTEATANHAVRLVAEPARSVPHALTCLLSGIHTPNLSNRPIMWRVFAKITIMSSTFDTTPFVVTNAWLLHATGTCITDVCRYKEGVVSVAGDTTPCSTI